MPSVNDFLEVIQQPSLGLVMATIPYLGTYRKAFDSYNRTRTISGSPQWRHNKGFGFFPSTNGAIVIADSGAAPELRVTSGTIICFVDKLNTLGTIQRVISKRDAGGTSFELLINAPVNQIVLFDGVASSVSTSALYSGAKMLGVRYHGGVTPAFYANGAYIGQGSVACSPTNNDADLWIANLFAGTGPLLSPLQCALIFNTQLTDLQISIITERFLNLPPVDRMSPQKGGKYVSIPADPLINAKCTEVFDGERAPNGTYIGKKNVSVGTVSGIVTSYSGGQVLPGAIVCETDAGAITLSNAAGMFSTDNGAVEVIFAPRFDTIPSQRWFFAANASLRTYLSQGGNILYATKGQPMVILSSPAGTAHANVPINTMISWWLDGATRRFEFFIDSVSQGTGVYTDNTAVSQASIFLATLGCQGKVSLVRTYNQRITPDEARTLYLEHAVTATRQASRNCYPESLATVTTVGKCGPWEVINNQLTWQEDGAKRKLVSLAANGAVFSPSVQAYGAWYWKQTGLDSYFAMFMSARSIISGTWNGNFVYLSAAGAVRLYRRTGAGSVLLANTVDAFVVAGVEYEFLVARRYDGLFKIYICGGAYTTWTLALSVTDSTYTTSVGIGALLPANATIAAVTTFLLGGTLLPNDVNWLKD